MTTEPAPRAVFPGVIPYFQVSDARGATALYEKAFGAKLVDRRDTPDGRAMHCHVEINGGSMMFNDPFPEYGHALEASQNFVLHLAVEEPRFWWNRAIEAGFEVVSPLEVAFWGDMYGQLRDAYGISWGIVGPAAGAERERNA